ncbi:rRNA maturation RNase YbeY [Candidatus Uhrbacteria bacterium]|nr:rRNA maturation RNase YbeY [Candidatus Uhrbacteria bacterium]
MIVAELNQSLLRGGQRVPLRLLQQVLKECSRVLNVRKSESISIGFISSVQMKRLNREWRGKDRITDVLSFQLDGTQMKGEVLLNYAQAKRQAQEMNHRVRDEICFLIVHGVLHLYGHDHEKKTDAQKMFFLQEQILTALDIDSRL